MDRCNLEGMVWIESLYLKTETGQPIQYLAHVKCNQLRGHEGPHIEHLPHQSYAHSWTQDGKRRTLAERIDLGSVP